MLFKVDTQHAMRALTVLASENSLVSNAKLAERVGAPVPALAKVLQRLALHGLVLGRPGPGGGYTLGRPAGEIALIEVVHLFEGPAFGKACVFGLPRCSDQEPCPLHAGWTEIVARIFRLLEGFNVGDLASGRVTVAALASRAGTDGHLADGGPA